MHMKQHNSRWLDAQRSGWTPAYVIIVAASLGILSQMMTGFAHDIFSDDAYYYTVVARNFVETGNISFDGISETNGFHPLLFWMQVALAAALGPGVSPFGFYSALIVMFALILLIFVGIFVYACRVAAQRASGLQVCHIFVSSIGFCFLWRHLEVYYAGMESTLALPLCAFTIILLYMRRYSSAGLVGAALVMARLDTFPYVLLPLSVLYSLYEWYERKRWLSAVKTLLRLVLPAIVFIISYMVFNYIHYGAWMPISGALRSSFPRINIQFHNIQGQFPSIALLMALIGGALLLYPRHITGRSRYTGFACVLVTLAQLASFVCFQKWAKPIPSWYQGLPLFTAAISLSFGLGNYLSPNRLRAVALYWSLLTALVNAGALARTLSYGIGNSGFQIGVRAETIDFIRSKPKGELWAYTDCGKFAFWTGRRFVNLDGLINDLEYQDRLRRQELGDYLKENDVHYLIAGVWDRSQTVDREYEPMYKYRVAPQVYSGDYNSLSLYVYSYLYDTYSEELMLPRASEIWRSSGHVDGRANARFVVYDLKMATESRSTPGGKE